MVFSPLSLKGRLCRFGNPSEQETSFLKQKFSEGSFLYFFLSIPTKPQSIHPHKIRIMATRFNLLYCRGFIAVSLSLILVREPVVVNKIYLHDLALSGILK